MANRLIWQTGLCMVNWLMYGESAYGKNDVVSMWSNALQSQPVLESNERGEKPCDTYKRFYADVRKWINNVQPPPIINTTRLLSIGRIEGKDLIDHDTMKKNWIHLQKHSYFINVNINQSETDTILWPINRGHVVTRLRDQPATNIHKGCWKEGGPRVLLCRCFPVASLQRSAHVEEWWNSNYLL